jgi:hypothetical protein
MTELVLKLLDDDYERLSQQSKLTGRSIQSLIIEMIGHSPKSYEPFDITKDPIFQIEGFVSDAPSDLSKNIDTYIN